MSEWKCIKCGKGVSDGVEFQADRFVKRGHKASCKGCLAAYSAGWYSDKGGKEKILERIQRERSRPEGRAADRRYDMSAKRAATLQRYKKTHPEKYVANYLFNNAVRDGKIVRPDRCEECGKKCKPEGHHEDYSKPYEVDWLCTKCHRLRG